MSTLQVASNGAVCNFHPADSLRLNEAYPSSMGDPGPGKNGCRRPSVDVELLGDVHQMPSCAMSPVVVDGERWACDCDHDELILRGSCVALAR